MQELIAQKQALRAQQLEKRKAIPAELRQAADAALCRAAISCIPWDHTDLLLGFYAVNGEADLTALYQYALQRGVKIAFPRCVERVMHFHLVQELSRPAPGRFGIPTPPEDAPLATPSAHTVCILPALAATRDGARLGYGGGFYDRFLVSFQGMTLLPIYECLLCPTLPQEPTDRKADHIITEKGVL